MLRDLGRSTRIAIRSCAIERAVHFPFSKLFIAQTILQLLLEPRQITLFE